MVLFNFRVDERLLDNFNEMCLLTGTNKSQKLRQLMVDELERFCKDREAVLKLKRKRLKELEKIRSNKIEEEISERNGWHEIGVSHVFPLPPY